MLKVEKLNKKYPSFALDNISFSLPKGYIMGFIGMNGAGKTTTLKSILNITQRDSGNITILGKDIDTQENEIKQEIGFMFGAFDYYPRTKVKKLKDIYSLFFENWDEESYKNYLIKFNIDETKKVNELSAGMKVKLGLAFALSHNAKLLILDEPTSGLDPVARDELLELFQSIVEDGERSILFSTHITSDLDKCADFIIFIKNGKLIENSTKDEIIDSHRLIEGSLDVLNEDLISRLVSYKKHPYGFSGLIKTNKIKSTDKIKVEVPNLQDIMVYYNKEKI